jgi:hypothetical protein
MSSATCACPTCELEVPEGLPFCPRCRAAAEGRPYDPDEVDRHERQFVLTLVVVSLGAVAIPRLLRSPAFTPTEKAVVAVLGLLNTGAVVAILWAGWHYLPHYVGMVAGRVR